MHSSNKLLNSNCLLSSRLNCLPPVKRAKGLNTKGKNGKLNNSSFSLLMKKCKSSFPLEFNIGQWFDGTTQWHEEVFRHKRRSGDDLAGEGEIPNECQGTCEGPCRVVGTVWIVSTPSSLLSSSLSSSLSSPLPSPLSMSTNECKKELLKMLLLWI